MHHPPEQHAVVDVAVVLAPGDLGGVPVEVPDREAVVDADVGPLDAAEEALDVVRVHAALCLVFLAVVHPEQLLQAGEVVVREVLVGMDARSLPDVLLDELPGLVRILAAHDAGERPLAAAAERRLLPERQDRQALEVLVFRPASVDAILLAVLLLDVARLLTER